jgi:predicted nucleic acid-binding protein
MIYLDSAAVVKLVHAEPESQALRAWLDARVETGWISSVLTEVESFRALARYAPAAVSRLPAVLDQIDLIDMGPSIRILARTAKPVTVRSLDAIHLGTALHYGSGLTSFVTYDKRLLEAARAAGLPVDSPMRQQPAAPQQFTSLQRWAL